MSPLELQSTEHEAVAPTEHAIYCRGCGIELDPCWGHCPKCAIIVGREPSQDQVSQEPVHGRTNLTGWLRRLALRRESKPRRASSGVGPLIVASLLFIVGLGVFVPELPVGMVFGVFAIVLACLVVYLWVTRTGGRRGREAGGSHDRSWGN